MIDFNFKGGKSTILKEAGKDATKKFEMFHDPTVLEAHSHLKIGTLSSSPSSPSPSSSSPKEGNHLFRKGGKGRKKKKEEEG